MHKTQENHLQETIPGVRDVAGEESPSQVVKDSRTHSRYLC